MGHPDHHVTCPRLRGPLDREVEHGHQHVHALDRESLLAQVGLVEKLLQGADLGEPAKQRALLVGRERLPVGARFDLLPKPDPLFVGADVLDLVGHGAAVGGLEVRKRLGERPPGNRDAEHLRRDGRHDLGREAQGRRIERGVADRGGAQRVEGGGEVAVHAEGLDERHRRGHVVQHLRGDRVRALLPLGGRGRLDQLVAHGGELEALVHQVVEALLAVQQVLDGRQERARLRALDHAVVVRAGDRHDLADPELPEPLLAHRGELGRIADRADGDDAPLSRHEPRHAGDGAESAGVGERHGGTGEVVRHQTIGAGLLDQRLVCGVERGEIQGLGALDHRHHEPAAPVLPLDIHRQAQRDPLGLDPERRAVLSGERMAHHGMALGRLDERVGDEVGEGDFLPAAGGLEGGVDPPPPLFEGGDRHYPEGGGRRHRQALLHVGQELGGGALDRRGARGESAVTDCRLRPRGVRSTGGRRGGGRGRSRGGAARNGRSVGRRGDGVPGAHVSRAVGAGPLADHAALEQAAPFRSHRGRIAEELLVHGLREARIGRFENVGIHGLTIR